jgi:prepilin-type N-terminal cleavage/methylation domain-containing protein
LGIKQNIACDFRRIINNRDWVGLRLGWIYLQAVRCRERKQVKKELTNRKDRGGFTLVEMLVVVLIIVILVGLISAVSIRGLHRAKAAAIGMEINQLSMALEQYKQQMGEYPPDFAGLGDSKSAIDLAAKNKVLIHLARAFPRFVISGNTITDKWNNLVSKVPDFGDTDDLTPAKALAFWLRGMIDSAQGKAIGFSKNPANPFDMTTPSRIGPFYDFDPGRLVSDINNLSFAQYFPPGVPPGSGRPYIYLRAEQGQPEPKREYYIYLNDGTGYTFKQGDTLPGNIPGFNPYWDQRNMGWVNPASFQILCCGLDGKFGKENVYPTGVVAGAGVPNGTPAGTPNLTTDVTGTDSTSFPAGNFDHIDDQTNFTRGTIGDDLP